MQNKSTFYMTHFSLFAFWKVMLKSQAYNFQLHLVLFMKKRSVMMTCSAWCFTFILRLQGQTQITVKWKFQIHRMLSTMMSTMMSSKPSHCFFAWDLLIFVSNNYNANPFLYMNCRRPSKTKIYVGTES